MTYEGVLKKMQTEFGNPIQYYLVFENSFLNVNQLLNKNLEISFVGFLELRKKKKYSVKDFVTIVLFQSCSGRLDYETRVEYGTSWYSRSGFSIRRKKYIATAYCLFGFV
jgi:hypothetical protein